MDAEQIRLRDLAGNEPVLDRTVAEDEDGQELSLLDADEALAAARELFRAIQQAKQNVPAES